MPPFHTLPKRPPDPRQAEARAINQAGLDRVLDELPKRYPHLQWVAFSEGEIVADDPNVDALLTRLEDMGLNPRYCMVHRVGDDWPGDRVYLPLFSLRGGG